MSWIRLRIETESKFDSLYLIEQQVEGRDAFIQRALSFFIFCFMTHYKIDI